MTKKLTPKETLYAELVVSNGGDKVKAYKGAGYSTNMSMAAICVQADKIYNKPKVNLKITTLQSIKNKVAKEEFEIDAKWVLGELKAIHELDILDIMSEDLKSFRALSEWPKIWRTSISGIDIMAISNGEDDMEQTIKKIKWPDKVKNLEMIGKHVNVKAWDKEEQQTTVTNNIMPVPVADSVESWEEMAKEQQDKMLDNDK